MKVVFIGAGNVATHLAKELYRHNFSIIQVYSRTIESAKALALQVEAATTNNPNEVITDADLYIFSLKDSVLTEIASQILPNKGLWIHTAGSMPLDILSTYTSRYGVLYPFQTFTKNRPLIWDNIPIFIEASSSDDLQELLLVAQQLSSKVVELSSEKRKYLHLTGVFACNFVNHMYALSDEILKKADLPFEIVLPLIEETCNKVHTISPKDAQTGPAIRFDENVINKHLDMIDESRTRDIYRLISESIHDKNSLS